MNHRDELLIHLHASLGPRNRLFQAMYDYDPSFQKMINLPPSHLEKEFSLPRGTLQHVHAPRYTPPRTVNSFPLTVLTRFSPLFPPRLQYMPDPPWVLYMLGEPRITFNPAMLGVVGTRNSTVYGERVLKHFIPPLVQQGVVIASGLAAGTDSTAHRLAIQKGKTIGILGHGFHHMYPAWNTSLRDMIAGHHLLISEYPLNTPPRKWQFPHRNRIISALSDALFIPEAKLRSGTMTTVRAALEQGRPVYTVPGPIFQPEAAGTNKIIQEGAGVVLGPNDLSEVLQLF
ncbi:DNA processing protein [Salsuginibacillus halophilus]|uniref:DNA processing protein n=1 Tax=Salsuginibacillus halophilus TaxID=517424 RepID=A0A2P8HYA2_9BACI|nr:DNA-processing protein DprA [Salsuginibacillus halophilus]PSL51177.1 DNA processing protein [Salsuginibacillus halophilus]